MFVFDCLMLNVDFDLENSSGILCFLIAKSYDSLMVNVIQPISRKQHILTKFWISIQRNAVENLYLGIERMITNKEGRTKNTWSSSGYTPRRNHL